jgi:heme-degrading monooxygenase HmoA
MKHAHKIPLFLCGLLMLGACTLGTPFRSAETLDALPEDAKVMVGMTYVMTGNDSQKNDVFWDHTMRVVDSLPSNNGYLGHKIRKQVLGNEGWTMTVWEDEQSLQKFVEGQKHQDAIKNGLDALVTARFVRFEAVKSDIPISWDNAERIMNEKGRDLYGRYKTKSTEQRK